MTHLPIPLAVLYAGLGGTVLALLVATASNRWSLRVFFLLALRLAIGWHFLFEGLYKVQSYYTGPTETNKPFTSEPYFRAAPGPLGERMRKEFSDPAAEIAAKVDAPDRLEVTPAAFAKLSAAEQAAKCPPAVAKSIDAVADEPARERERADKAEQKELAEAKTDEEKAAAVARAEAARAAAAARADVFASQASKDAFQAAKATYARWVYGVDARDCKVKGVTGDVALTAPQRRTHLEWVRQQARDADERQAHGLGNGTGTNSKRLAEYRGDVLAAEEDLARDANAFIAELKTALNGGTAVKEERAESRGQKLDRFTMWFLVAVGACLMAGLLTRLACVLATGFLAMTYLAHPAFPWYPLPPNTEGNPVFVNKNVIEALALLALACHPTGRWLGLDALLLRPFCKSRGECPAPETR